MQRFVRVLVRFGLGLLALVVLALALRAEENWRAERDLRAQQSALRARGESLDIHDFIPPAVADEENFAAAPYIVRLLKPADGKPAATAAPTLPDFLKGTSAALPGIGNRELGLPADLAGWQRHLQASPDSAAGILTALAKFDEDLSQFSAAAARPRARFPLDYDLGLGMQFPHLSMMLRFPKVFALRAIAQLENGDSAAAFRDLETLFQVQAALAAEPVLISHLVRMNVLQFAEQVIWEGNVRRRWSDAELAAIAQRLGHTDILADYARVIRGERALGDAAYHRFATNPGRAADELGRALLMPQLLRWFTLAPARAVFYRNEILMNQLIQDGLLPVVDPPSHQVFPERDAFFAGRTSRIRSTPYTFLTKLTAPVYHNATVRTASAASTIDQARTACAIERFRLATGRLPENLESLDPHAPSDVIDGAPLHYRRDGDSYVLYSVGWNRTDDSGKVVRKSNGTRRDDEQGDWVWFGSIQPAAAAK